MFTFLAYLGLENWALWIPAGENMYCLISYSNVTGDILYLEHRLWLRILRGYFNFKMMSREEKNDVGIKMKSML